MPPLVLDGSGGVSGVDGTASNPAIEGTDSNTGIFYPAADTVAIGTGGTEALRVNSSQNVGIGTGSTINVSGMEISRATGVSPTPVELRLTTTTNDSGWSTTNPWGRLSFYSADASAGGAKVHASIQTTAQSSTGGNSNLEFFVTDTANGTLFRTLSFQGVGTNTTQTVFYSGGGAQAMTLDASGNLGVVSTSPVAVLDVVQPSASANGGRVAYFRSTASGDVANNAVIISKFDNNTTTSQIFMKFEVNNTATSCGRINANGANTAAFGSTSDQRVKENIEDLPSQLQNILALRPVEFDYIESYGGGHQIGFIAQEMQEVYPDVVSADESEEQILSITGWSKTEARLVKAIQELNAKVEAQAAEIAALKGNA